MLHSSYDGIIACQLSNAKDTQLHVHIEEKKINDNMRPSSAEQSGAETASHSVLASGFWKFKSCWDKCYMFATCLNRFHGVVVLCSTFLHSDIMARYPIALCFAILQMFNSAQLLKICRKIRRIWKVLEGLRFAVCAPPTPKHCGSGPK